MRVTLIRHGKTAGNLDRRYTGVTDAPLCPAGRAEVERAKKDEALETVFVSPLVRARETAAILFPNAEQIVVEDLHEMDFGDFEGRTADEMANDPAYRAWVEDGCRGACPNGESTESFRKRVVDAFQKTLQTADGDPVFVVHGGVIMSVFGALAEPPRGFYEWQAENLGGFSAEVCRTSSGVVLSDVQPVQY